MEHLPWARILSSVNSFNSNTSLVMVVGLAPPFYRGETDYEKKFAQSQSTIA